MSLNLRQLCRQRTVIFDGAMGTNIQKLNLSNDDFWGKQGCNEILNLSQPQVIQQIHADFLNVGCDFIETNTFGANGIVLKEYDLQDKIYEINLRAAQLARQVARDFSSGDKPRFVAGSIGPGTKLPSLRQISFRELQQAYLPQIQGLIDGGVDLLLIETSQDLLHLKTLIITIDEIFQQRKQRLPIQAQVTIETTGKMLVGSDMQTVIVSLSPLPVDVLGLNCSTGPKPMTGHIRTLSKHWERLISVMPNAGMPRVENGNIFYDLTPLELARDLKYFASELGANIIGGCCGTTPEHLKAVVNALSDITPMSRKPEKICGASSLYSVSLYNVTPKPLIIGERCNATGSKIFREFLLKSDLQGMISVAQKQEKEQAHLLDISTAYVGLDEAKAMAEFTERLNTDTTLPLMIDSTKPEVIENALQRIAGKAIINSVNLEDGGERLHKVLALCKKYGAAVVALTIDEQGMAKTAGRKLEIARRLYGIINREFGLPPEDIFVDTLTFTLGSGDEELRNAARETLTAIREIKKEFPEVNTILGVSNISYGLKPTIRHRLNSVFLAHAIEAGLDAAILHAGKIIPLFKISSEERKLLEDLIFNRRTPSYDPLMATINFYKGKDLKAESDEQEQSLPLEKRLQHRIINGDSSGLEEDLNSALQSYSALEIINTILLPAMKEVGELFGKGEMQLPFVLQSAETMKAAVKILEPFIEKKEGQNKGKIVLATVKGDVHDIGKNLVDIILTNNGYEVINIGIKQPIETIIQAYRENNAHAIGLSGLLVQSTIVMKENLETMERLGISAPVLLGGAALTEKYVSNELKKIYRGGVFYARDAFAGLALLEKIVANQPVEMTVQPQVRQSSKINRTTTADKKRSSIRPIEPPQPPFWGVRTAKGIVLNEIVPFINKSALFHGRWQVRQGKRNAAEYQQIVSQILEPKLRELIEKAIRELLVLPAIVYGYFPCNSKGNDLLVYRSPADREPEVVFRFPRQTGRNGLCLADYFQPIGSPKKDVLAMQLVTVGKVAANEAKRLYKNDQYQNYLYWHGFTVELTEALAEYWHQQIRRELNIADQDSSEINKLVSGNYRGARYSFGYPACPNLSDQQKLFQLLKPEQIGVYLTEGFQMVPEQSTSAIIVHHPKAKYFRIK